MNNNSVKLHRVLKTSPEKIYRAFTNAEAFATWLPPYGFTSKVESLNAEVGGSYKMSFTNFTTKNDMAFGGKYLELIPGALVKYTSIFDNPHLPGEMTVTVNIKEVIGGTELRITQENIPSVIPADMCYLGWQESLSKLAQLVEPEINQ